MVATGLTRGALAELRQGSTVDPLPPPEADPFELIAALTGPMGFSVAPRCASAIMKTLGDRGAGVSFRAIDQRCREVAARQRPPESLSEPLERTMRALDEGGVVIRNPAAYCTRSFTNWDRELR
jgi:hypothetical protein